MYTKITQCQTSFYNQGLTRFDDCFQGQLVWLDSSDNIFLREKKQLDFNKPYSKWLSKSKMDEILKPAKINKIYNTWEIMQKIEQVSQKLDIMLKRLFSIGLSVLRWRGKGAWTPSLRQHASAQKGRGGRGKKTYFCGTQLVVSFTYFYPARSNRSATMNEPYEVL